MMSDQDIDNEMTFFTGLIFAVGLVAACAVLVIGWAWL